MKLKLPPKGFVFWPVGTGDSTTIVVNDRTVIQVDLHHLECSGDEDDPRIPVIDRLVELLSQVDEKPYLSVFVLTHPDEDHCLGFAELLRRVTIGEVWFTPRVFREYKKDLCDDAVTFKDEAMRRVKKTISGAADSGDRVRIIGYDDLLKEEEFEGFPAERLTVPGNEVTELDGEECGTEFRAFIHAPFKDDSAGERNDTSVGMQVTLRDGEVSGTALLLGDLCYPTVKRIFDSSSADDLMWNVLLAPHHCSKSAMYWKEEGKEEETLRQDILDVIEKAAANPGHIVASSDPIPTSNEPGDNPPHAKAKNRYEEIAPDGFMCTQEHPDSKKPVPIVFAFGEDGFEHVGSGAKKQEGRTLTAAAAAARGSNEPPKDRVGFGAGIRDD